VSESRFVVGIDLGGTKILSICLTDRLEVTREDRRPTDAERGPDAVIETMIESALAAAAGTKPAAVGISAPGPVDIGRGVVTTPPNLPGWRDVPLARLVGEKLDLLAWVENDANAAAIAEHRIGAGKGVNHMILVTVGTGIGGGLILDGRLYHGASGAAGEVGHMVLDPRGPICGCGRHGCLEVLASGRALEAAAESIARDDPGGVVARIAREEGVSPDARILDLAANKGDRLADEAVRRAGRYLGAGLTNLVNIFNPQLIVIGGSLRKAGDRYVGEARRVVEREAFPQHRADVRIVEAALGDEAPAVGAGLIALQRWAGP
jgi:glucokinase